MKPSRCWRACKHSIPADADVLYQSARLHMKAWNDTLFEMFQKAPTSYRVNQISAEIFEIQGRYAEAAAEYRKAIEKNPAALNLHFRLGRALLLESHSPENLALARREFEAELALNPGDAVAEYEIGQILLAGQAAARGRRSTSSAPLAHQPRLPGGAAGRGQGAHGRQTICGGHCAARKCGAAPAATSPRITA